MSLQTTASKVQYFGNASTSTPYPVTFPFFNSSDLVVLLRDSNGTETTLSLDEDYFVTGAGSSDGGNITTALAYSSANTITIFRQVQPTQLTSYVENDKFPALSHERALDKLTMLVQQLQRSMLQCLRLSESSPSPLPLTAQNLADVIFGFDSEGNLILKGTDALLDYIEAPALIFNYPTSTWSDAAHRATKTPSFVGQLGTQRSDGTVWIATGTTAGAWEQFTLLLAAAITTAMIQDGAITAAKLASGSVGTLALSDAAVTAAKLAAGSVTAAVIASNSVSSAALQSAAVTAAKLAVNSVYSAAIQAAAVTAIHVAANAIGTASLQGGCVTRAKLADDAKRSYIKVSYRLDYPFSAVESLSDSAWNIRALNTKDNDSDSLVSAISSNIFTLPAGTYEILAYCPVMQTGSSNTEHQARLFNDTDGTPILLGSHGITKSNFPDNSVISGQFTLSNAKAVKIQHWVSDNCVGGRNVSNGGTGKITTEIFTQIMLWKVA